MTILMIDFNADWADEFDCEQFAIIKGYTKEEAESEIMEAIQKCLSFGTNEGFYEGQLDIYDFSINEISEDDLKSLSKFFNIDESVEKGILTSFGVGIIDNIFDS